MGPANYKHLLLLLFSFILLTIYFIKVDSIPFVRLDDGELMQLSETFATHGYLGSRMMDTGHNEHLHYHVHPPFYYLANGLVYKLAGVGILQSRMVSLLSALAVIFITFMLSNQMLNLPWSIDRLLILSALFLSTPMFFVLARSNRPEMLTLLLVLSALLTHARYQRTNGANWLIISALCCGLALTTQAYAVFAFIFLYFSLYFGPQRERRLLLVFIFIFTLPLIIYGWWISQDPSSFIYQALVARHAASNFGLLNLFERYRYFFTSFENAATTLFFIFSICLLFLLRSVIKDKATTIMFTPPLFLKLCFMTVFIIIPVINKYYYVVLLPFIYLFFIFILDRNKNRWFYALLYLYLIINLLGLAIYCNKYWGYDYPAYGRRIIAQLPAPGSFSVLASPSLYPALRSYHFYALNNGSIIRPDQTYQGLKSRIARLKIKYIVFQEYNEELYAKLNYLTQFLARDCRLIAKVQDPYYGSEGAKRNNYLKIYLVVGQPAQ